MRHHRLGLTTLLALVPLTACEPTEATVLPPTYDDVSYLHLAIDDSTAFTVVAREQPGGRQTIDIRLPAAGAGPAPVLVVVPGGGWGGHNENDPPLGGFEHFLDAGFAIVNVDYRSASLETATHFPQLAYDVDRAVRWVRAHSARLGIDPNRLILHGHSAGAHLAAAVAAGNLPVATDVDSPVLPQALLAQSSQPDGLLLYAGPYDVADSVMNDQLLGSVAILVGCEPGTPTCIGIARRASQALTTRSMPRSMLAHARDDGVVDISQSEQLFDHLCSIGTDTWFEHPDEGSHLLAGLELDVVDQFLAAWQPQIAPAQPASPDSACAI